MIKKTIRKSIYNSLFWIAKGASSIMDLKMPFGHKITVTGNFEEESKPTIYAVGNHRSIKEGVFTINEICKVSTPLVVGKYYVGPVIAGISSIVTYPFFLPFFDNALTPVIASSGFGLGLWGTSRYSAYIPIKRKKDSIERKDQWLKDIEITQDMLARCYQNGDSIAIWIEGTRSKDGKYIPRSGLKHQYKKIIESSDLRVVPVSTSEDFISKYDFFVHFGEPIEFKKNTRIKLEDCEDIRDQINNSIYRNMPTPNSHLFSLYHNLLYKSNVEEIHVFNRQSHLSELFNYSDEELYKFDNWALYNSYISFLDNKLKLNLEKFASAPSYYSNKLVYASNEASSIPGLESKILAIIKGI